MKSKHKRALVIVAGILLSAAAVLYFVWQMGGHWGAAGQALARANYLYVIPSVGFIALMYALRVLRWRVFLNPVGKVRYSAIASATCIGFPEEDYSSIQSIARTGGFVPDEYWEQRLTGITAVADLTVKLGVKLLATHVGFIPHDKKDPKYAVMIDRG